MSAIPDPPDRRTFLRVGLVGGLTVLAGCAASTGRPAVHPTTAAPKPTGQPTTAAPSGSPTVAGSPSAELPDAAPWVARAGEVHPAVKRRALSALETIGTWGAAGGGSAAAAAARLRALGVESALAAQAGPLLGGEQAAVTRVVDAQYGGILASSSSVLAVLEQWRLDADGHLRKGGTTFDVRLVAASPRWRITELRPASPGPAASRLPASASAVLASTRIRLPHAARADIAANQVHASVLGALLALGQRYVVDVSIVRSGHPIYVFGTSRRSDHPRGRAVDIWALDDRRVVDPANRAFVERAMRVAASVGPYQVGGPVDLDGAGLQYFSDQTHQDHLHLGFRT
jgi:hypothetical protein